MDLNKVAEIVRPGTRADLPSWQPGDAVLAGGTWLFSEPQPDTARLVDLAGLGWPAAEILPEGLRLGATCTLRALERLELPPAWLAAPLLGLCCRALAGSFKVTAAATVGGNLCLALAASPMAPLAAVLDGTCVVWTPEGGTRAIPAARFALGERRTALLPGEVLRRVDLPAAALRRRAAFRRASLTPYGRSAALLIGTLDPADGAFALTVAAAVAAPVVLRFPTQPGADELRAEIGRAIPDRAWWRDPHGSPEWRRHMTHLLAEEIREELAQP